MVDRKPAATAGVAVFGLGLGLGLAAWLTVTGESPEATVAGPAAAHAPTTAPTPRVDRARPASPAQAAPRPAATVAGGAADPLAALDEEIAALFDGALPDIPDHLDRDEADRLLQDAFSARADAAQALTLALAEVMAETDDPELQGRAAARMGDVYGEIAAVIEDMPMPPHLNDRQREVYAHAISLKSQVQWDKSADAYAEALTRLPLNHPERPGIERRMADMPAPPDPPE